uniref:Uncharacterized protein n=1 Tax=Pipistrellus kuhlii TaxID=59472 RepID=A0A7J7RGS3_PIPKU|nr:hypothetical protein mPipKuh1_010542 [Pipistrellus kuhlii]
MDAVEYLTSRPRGPPPPPPSPSPSPSSLSYVGNVFLYRVSCLEEKPFYVSRGLGAGSRGRALRREHRGESRATAVSEGPLWASRPRSLPASAGRTRAEDSPGKDAPKRPVCVVAAVWAPTWTGTSCRRLRAKRGGSLPRVRFWSHTPRGGRPASGSCEPRGRRFEYRPGARVAGSLPSRRQPINESSLLLLSIPLSPLKSIKIYLK